MMKSQVYGIYFVGDFVEGDQAEVGGLAAGAPGILLPGEDVIGMGDFRQEGRFRMIRIHGEAAVLIRQGGEYYRAFHGGGHFRRAFKGLEADGGGEEDIQLVFLPDAGEGYVSILDLRLDRITVQGGFRFAGAPGGNAKLQRVG